MVAPPAPPPTGWIGVDLDCTLAVYPHNFPDVGPPIPQMVNRVKELRRLGIEIRIFTARVAASNLVSDQGNADDADFAADQRRRIEAWCLEHLGEVLPVTHEKDFSMALLFDDRCVQVEANTGRLFAPAQIDTAEGPILVT